MSDYVSMKCCPKCKENKPWSEYYFDAKAKNTCSSYCKKCSIIDSRERQRENPEYWRSWHRRKKYGMSEQEWDEMFAAQGYCCAICKINEQPYSKGKGWCTDHDHNTGKVRGILCYACNIILAKAKDNIDILEAAKQYLLYNSSNGSSANTSDMGASSLLTIASLSLPSE